MTRGKNLSAISIATLLAVANPNSVFAANTTLAVSGDSVTSDRPCSARRRAVGLTAVGVHTVAYLGVTTAAALFVYTRLGVAFLRSAWLNLDWVWAGALVVTGVAVLVW